METHITRQCGGCSTCCRLLPVKSLNKPAGQRCKHQKFGKGCTIYDQRPLECRFWFCRWLINDDADALSRPDRAHYVIDFVPDYVTVNGPGLRPVTVPVVQIWVDPHYPEAHRDPELRKWLFRRGAENWASIVRFSAEEAMFLIPPQMSDRGMFEERSLNSEEIDHTPRSVEETYAKLAEAGALPR
jgi:hypothetical protein